MGFKLKKKNTGDTAQKSSSGVLTKTKSKIDEFAKLFGESDKSKPFIQMAIASIIVAIILLLVLFYTVPRNNDLTRSLGELKLLSQTLSRQAAEATGSGSAKSIEALVASQKKFKENLEVVKDIHASSKQVEGVEKTWKQVSADIDMIATHQKIINQLYDTNIAVADVIPGMQAEYNSMVDQMARDNMSSTQVVIAKNQVFLAERILRSIGSVLSGSENTRVSADDFNADTETFGTYLNAQLNGSADLGVTRIDKPELRESLESIKADYNEIVQLASTSVLKNSDQIFKVRQASSDIFAQSDNLLKGLDRLSVNTGVGTILPALILLLALGAFLFAVFKLLALRSESDKLRVTRLQDEYDRNQNAILRLLDEIADLADGDLSSYATVSEDFTGAIADSINFAIDQLRDLVSRINDTSQEVAQYTQNTQQITNQLAEASEHQAQEIAGASTAINEIAHSIDHVSANAAESAEVAQRSVQIASNGADVVNRSIEGMDTIREQIQETSKRIKRLGESSQEIGNIVSLINDIADQTNILALNAAIQASMAGEAGRGFAVVADEVQRLAERSASATKQIETLVKTIQTDTNEAVISMEQTTSEVVRGANLAKDAGVALGEIQTVSSNLAGLIASISESAKLQSASAGHIANTMNVVQEITSQTTGATFDTARSVSELASMADSLRQSVSDFKLPD